MRSDGAALAGRDERTVNPGVTEASGIVALALMGTGQLYGMLICLGPIAHEMRVSFGQTTLFPVSYLLLLTMVLALSRRLWTDLPAWRRFATGAALLVLGACVLAAAGSLPVIVAGGCVEGTGAGLLTAILAGKVATWMQSRTAAGMFRLEMWSIVAVLVSGGGVTYVAGWRVLVVLLALAAVLLSAVALFPGQKNAFFSYDKGESAISRRDLAARWAVIPLCLALALATAGLGTASHHGSFGLMGSVTWVVVLALLVLSAVIFVACYSSVLVSSVTLFTRLLMIFATVAITAAVTIAAAGATGWLFVGVRQSSLVIGLLLAALVLGRFPRRYIAEMSLPAQGGIMAAGFIVVAVASTGPDLLLLVPGLFVIGCASTPWLLSLYGTVAAGVSPVGIGAVRGLLVSGRSSAYVIGILVGGQIGDAFPASHSLQLYGQVMALVGLFLLFLVSLLYLVPALPRRPARGVETG